MENKTFTQYNNFINGEWTESISKKYYSVSNPSNYSEIIGEFPLSEKEDLKRAIEHAQEAFLLWRKTQAKKRAEYIYKFSQELENNINYLAEILCKEQGKPIKEAISEVTRAVRESRFIASEAERLDGVTLPSDRIGVENKSIRSPIGVVAAITPWNFPVLSPIRKILPAIMAGCTVVLKPASETPLTSVIITEILEKTNIPKGVVNLTIGKGSTIGNYLVGHPLVKGVSFTGSTSVGHKINEIAAKDFTKVQLEMGGKNPAVVGKCKQLNKVADEIVNACFGNAGQRCTAISRVIVLDEEADKLEELIIDRVKNYTLGDGMNKNNDMGPLINQDAVDFVSQQIKIAVQDGAKIAAGGNQLNSDIYKKGFYFEPTVLTKVDPSMEITKKEVFGPLLVIIRAHSFEEAVNISNNTEYGLTSSIFTDSWEYAFNFTEDVESGMVHVNNGTNSEGHMPFGGIKHSGLGAFSIGSTIKDFYTDLKVIYTQYK